MPCRIAYVVMKYPTLSQTFIEREMLALAGLGFDISVHPCLDFRHPSQINLPMPTELAVCRAESAVWVVLAGLVSAVWLLLRRPALVWLGWRTLRSNWPRHWEGWFHTLWGTLFALALARSFRANPPDWFHGAWATAPATVAMVLGKLCGRPYSFGAHAYDLHRHGGDPLLAAKMQSARFVHTTTQANVVSLQNRFPARSAKIVLSRRGLPHLPTPVERPTRSPAEPWRLLSVGRLVPKKGHVFQIAACRELAQRGFPFQLKIIGEGPLRQRLAADIETAGLASRIELVGECSPAQTQQAYAWADIFWHTGVVDAQGDRDGLPNVIPEAFAHGLPVIASLAGGVGEAVTHGQTGLVVDPPEPTSLANAVEELASNPELTRRLKTNGRAWVEQNFLSATNARILAESFELL